VGTGFHPELTGRENIYLNGAILGMTRNEINRKFDEIVSFAGVEEFIDTPLKYYSTGMQMRLAFAVAAHLEPEILLVDEVLAVGDLEFQKKCLGKMEEVSKGGRTVLFVSHQMNQIRRLCERVIWLNAGQICRAGKTAEVASAYEVAMTSGDWAHQGHSDVPRVKARFLRWEIIDPKNEQPNVLTSSLGPVTIKFVLQVNELIKTGHHTALLINDKGQIVWGTGVEGFRIEVGEWELVYTLSSLPLRPGFYRWRVSLWDTEVGLIDDWEAIPELVVATVPLTHWIDNLSGILNIPWGLKVFSIDDRESPYLVLRRYTHEM
jgi:lipopolysaccharide transport system ATP-binding protein